MMLLITSSQRGLECMAALEKACGTQVDGAGSVRAALSRLKKNEYKAIILDQNLLDADPLALDTLAPHFGTASPIYVSLALHSLERVVREVQISLQRRDAERALAAHAASKELRNQLNNAVTGILLSSQLALETVSLPSGAEAKLRTVYELAEDMRRQLGIG